MGFFYLKLLPVLFIFSIAMLGCNSNKDWRTASRLSAGIAPEPSVTSEAIVQVYGADAWGWRGIFAIHTWIATKRTGEDEYTVYDVVGWRSYRNRPVMGVVKDIPDRYWYGAEPKLLKEHRGTDVDELIDKIDQAADQYPWKNYYKAFPGPNSNTFVAWIGKQVPELELKLPFSAIGSGYVDNYSQSE